jgi:hypothetical protein
VLPVFLPHDRSAPSDNFSTQHLRHPRAICAPFATSRITRALNCLPRRTLFSKSAPFPHPIPPISRLRALLQLSARPRLRCHARYALRPHLDSRSALCTILISPCALELAASSFEARSCTRAALHWTRAIARDCVPVPGFDCTLDLCILHVQCRIFSGHRRADPLKYTPCAAAPSSHIRSSRTRIRVSSRLRLGERCAYLLLRWGMYIITPLHPYSSAEHSFSSSYDVHEFHCHASLLNEVHLPSQSYSPCSSWCVQISCSPFLLSFRCRF